MSYQSEILFEACYSVWPDEELVVEADGKGGATLMIVERNYPIDFFIKRHHCFSSEEAACDAADEKIAASYG
jgi:hypothetical protein